MNDEMRPNPVPRFIHDDVLRELAEAKSRIATQDMTMACIDDIINGDDRSGMTGDAVLVAQVSLMARELKQCRENRLAQGASIAAVTDQRDEARECLREAIDEVEWYESKTGGRTGLSHIKKWRNAAGLGATSIARAIIDAGVYDATEGTENNQ
jgi:hypothetical protein